MTKSPNIKKAFVCGHPIKHSRSPMLHGHWLSTYSINGSYERQDIEPENLKSFVTSLKENGFAGGNFTIPHKEAMFDLVDQADEVAQKIGAVNTIWFESNKLCGSNTDAYGFVKNLDAYQPSWSKLANSKSVLVVGAGGASRAILYALLDRGFDKIYLANRTLKKAETLAEEFSPKIIPLSLDSVEAVIPDIALLVNTTSVGMKDTDEFPFQISNLSKEAIVTDIVYTPLQTKLLKAANAQGNRTVDGLGMLLHQAVPGFEKWFGKKPEVTIKLRSLILKDIEGHS